MTHAGNPPDGPGPAAGKHPVLFPPVIHHQFYSGFQPSPYTRAFVERHGEYFSEPAPLFFPVFFGGFRIRLEDRPGVIHLVYVVKIFRRFVPKVMHTRLPWIKSCDASTGRQRRPGLPGSLGPGIPLPADTASAQPSLPKKKRPHKSQQRAGAGCIAAMGRNFCLSHDTGLLTACTDARRMASGAGRMSP